MCDEANESFAVVLTMSRCHFDEIVTAHWNEVLMPEVPLRSIVLWMAFLTLGPLIQGISLIAPMSNNVIGIIKGQWDHSMT